MTTYLSLVPAVAPGRVPPHSVEAEEQLLSAVMMDGGAVLTRAVTSGVRSTSFYVPANRVIFDVLQGLHADGQPLDLHVVAERLKDSRQLDEFGGYPYLTRVSGRIPTTAGASFFIERVVELAQLRAAIHAGTALVEEAYNYSGGGVPSHLGRAVERVAEAVQARSEARSWPTVVSEARELTKARILPESASPASSWSIPWAWGNLDREFQPMEPGELIVVAARPSVGKSTLARMQAVHAADNGFPTLLSSLEVTDTELAVNLAANVSGVRSRRDLDRLHPDDTSRLLAAFDKLSAIPRFAVSHTDEWLDEIIGRATAFKARHGLSLLVVDYLQLIADCKSPQRSENESSSIGRVTRALKRFAVREACVVLLLSQLNRDVERDDRDPRLSDLRGSGSIEEDANRVIFLHRPDLIPKEFAEMDGCPVPQGPVDDRDWHFIRLIQAKGRNQGTGIAGLRLDRATATLSALTAPKAPPLRYTH